jgi:hypothetical protein
MIDNLERKIIKDITLQRKIIKDIV